MPDSPSAWQGVLGRTVTQEQQQNRPPTPFHKLQYAYDRVGNVLHMKNNVSVRPWKNAPVFMGPLDVTYGYDNQYQLTSTSGKYRGNVAYGYQYSDTYRYDETGNITRKAQSQDRLVWDNQTVNTNDADPVSTQLAGSRFDRNLAPVTYTLDYQYTGPRPHATNAITETQPGQAAATRTYSYDDNGNNTGNTFRSVTRTQVWDEESRLKQVTIGGGSVATFRYDDGGERTKKHTTAGDSWYVNQYFVLLPGNRPTKHIFAGETRIASKTDPINMQTPVVTYYHPDHLGTTSYVSSATQDLIQHERYFAFGELWRPNGEQEEVLSTTDRRDWLFTSKEWDVDTSLYYFGARYFDPHADVWQSTDPILASYIRGGPNAGVFAPANLGLYSYAWNNPVRLRDPNGLLCRETGASGPCGGGHDPLAEARDAAAAAAEAARVERLQARFNLLSPEEQEAEWQAARDHWQNVAQPMGQNIAGGIFGAIGYGISSAATDDEQRQLAASGIGASIDAVLQAAALASGGREPPGLPKAPGSTTPSPALEGSPYHPASVAARVRPPYETNLAHVRHSPVFNPKKSIEPADAAKVYAGAARTDMGTWYGRGAGGWYRFSFDNVGSVHFSGIINEDRVPSSARRALGVP